MTDSIKALEPIASATREAYAHIRTSEAKRGVTFLESVTNGDWSVIFNAYQTGLDTFAKKDGSPVTHFSQSMKEALGLDVIHPMELTSVKKIVATGVEAYVQFVKERLDAHENNESEGLPFTSVRTSAQEFVKPSDAHVQGVQGEEEPNEETNEPSKVDPLAKFKKAVKACVDAGIDVNDLTDAFTSALLEAASA